MARGVAYDQRVLAPRSYPLSDGILSYLAELTRLAGGVIHFRTGAGRIFRDLLLHWPALHGREIEAQELCQRIADAVFPLAGALFAQAVEVTITISSTPIKAPQRIEALSTYVLFDPAQRIERLYFLSPREPLPDAGLLDASRGVAALCRPLNYRYHTLKDDRRRWRKIRIGLFELPKRLLDALYEIPDFVPREKAILATMRNKVYELPHLVERFEEARDASLSHSRQHLTPAAPVIAMVTSLSALPPPVRALERQIMKHVVNPGLSPEVRLGLRQVAQSLRAVYPQTVIADAALVETQPSAMRVEARALWQNPKASLPVPQERLAASQIVTPVVAAPADYHPMAAPVSVASSVLLPLSPRAAARNVPAASPIASAGVKAGVKVEATAAPLALPTGAVPSALPAQRVEAARVGAGEPQQSFVFAEALERVTTPVGPEGSGSAAPSVPREQAFAMPEAEPVLPRVRRSRQERPRLETTSTATATEAEPVYSYVSRPPASRPGAYTPIRGDWAAKQAPYVPHQLRSYHHGDYRGLSSFTPASVFPHTTPHETVGRLESTANLKQVRAKAKLEQVYRKRLWATLPTPSPMPMPRSALFKTRK